MATAFYPVMYEKLDRSVSGRLAVVEAEEAAESFPAYDRAGPVEVGGRQDELAAQALMVSLLVLVGEVLANRGAQMALTEKDELAEALATCRRALLNKSLAGSRL